MISDFAKEKVFWTKKMNLSLVKFIQSRPSIWNPRHPKYTSVGYKDRIYSEFASKYGDEFTGQAVKDRWTNIRSSFANYLRKVRASERKGDGEEYKVNWHLWEPCQFLLKVNRNIKREDLDNENSTNEFKYEDTNWPSDEEYYNNTVDNHSTNNIDMNCKNIAENLVKIFKGAKTNGFELQNTKYDHVGRTVSEKLNKLSSLEAGKLSMKILDILCLYDQNNHFNPNNFKTEC